MDNENTIYTFKIDDLTPESMPFGRLVEYYSEIAKMIGMAENMHLIDIVKSSHASQFKVDRISETKVQKRLMEINEGTAPKLSLRAQETINAMLKDDSTSGQFAGPRGENIIVFPGKRADDQAIVNIRDTATFIGELYHIAGEANYARIRIRTDNYGVVFCTASKDLAKALRDFLFDDVRVSGRGMWRKSSDGTWNVDDFTITDFIAVEREGLSKAVKRLRAIEVRWPDDPLGMIDKIEEKSGRLQ